MSFFLTNQVPMELASLDPKYVFILDIGMEIYIWYGQRSNPITRSKARYAEFLFDSVHCFTRDASFQDYI